MQSHREALNRQLDELALKSVLSSGPGLVVEATAALSLMEMSARADGYSDFAMVAAELGTTLATLGTDAEATVRTLAAGLDRLRQVLGPVANNCEPGRVQQPSLGSDPELVADFLVESREHLASVEARLLTLERTPENPEALQSVFRSFHTIKGLAGFLGFGSIEEAAHETENLLDLARNGKLMMTPEAFDVVLVAADYLARCLDMVAAGLDPGEVSRAGLFERIRNLQSPDEIVIQASATPPASPSGNCKSPAGVPETKPNAAVAESKSGAREQRGVVAAVRVDTAKLDYLVDMVGEMVIAQSLVQHDPDLIRLNRSRLARNLSQLARITVEVQRTAMAMRMVPIGHLFRKTARLVRDLARKSGKRADLEICGEDTELDRNIVEQISDPLMHMVRNALDHGIEPPEDRLAAGKNPVARIELRAAHQAGQIVIEVSDDGRGLDSQKLLAKAIERGLVVEGARIDEQEIFALIFQPGFSTAERVTEVSGRGVGMDVVRRHIQKLRGRVDVQSALGRGAKFSLKVPLTLAIIDGLVVGVGGERFIVPIYQVREMLRPTPDMLFTVENRREMALVRGHLLPVVRLYRRFKLQPRSENAADGLLIVVETQERVFCLLVDELIGKQEVVIKPLGETFKQAAAIAGGAILGDGRVGLILEISGVFHAG
jgi:two-component system chemotaxis sensor kinase CheA